MGYQASSDVRCGCCVVGDVIRMQRGMWGGSLRRVQPSLRRAEISDLVRVIFPTCRKHDTSYPHLEGVFFKFNPLSICIPV